MGTDTLTSFLGSAALMKLSQRKMRTNRLGRGYSCSRELATLAIVGLTLPGCQEGPRAADNAVAAQEVSSASSATEEQSIPVRWLDSLRLEENEQVINVLPFVHEDSDGGFLIADYREAQIRRYNSDGSLDWHFGRKGQGPEEFRGPSLAVRVPAAGILVADLPSRLVLLDSAGSAVSSVLDVDLQRMERVALLDSSTVLISGLAVDPRAQPSLEMHTSAPRLHVLDVTTGVIERSFFIPFDGFDPDLAVMAGSVAFALLPNEGVVAAALPKDSLYFFDAGGYRTSVVRLPSRRFRAVKPLSPQDFRNPSKRRAWLEGWDSITDVFFVAPGTVLVQYRSISDGAPSWSLVGTSTDGTDRLFEWSDSPRLLSVIADSLLVFEDPNSLEPNRWSIASLVTGR